MSVTYLSDVVSNKKYNGNVVILIGSQYFAIRQPDSGLSIASPYDKSVISLLLNPTTIDVRNVTTTIASYSFKLLDKNGIISTIMAGTAQNFAGQNVTIWIGRTGVGMDFSNYFQLPIVRIAACDHTDNSYNFTAQEQAQRIDKPLFSDTARIGVDILSGTTEITMQDDISGFPASGMVQIEQEFIQYASLDLVNNRLSGCIRGEIGTTPTSHAALTPAPFVEQVIDHPLNILLQILISGGGGGPYDVLSRGLGISASLIDVAGIQSIRDSLFLGTTFSLVLMQMDSALNFIENEILAPLNIRFSYSNAALLTIAVLDKAKFVEESSIIAEKSISKYPKWSFDASNLVNQIEISWDYNPATQVYNQIQTFTQSDSISTYGLQQPLQLQFQGVSASYNGAAFVASYASHLLTRIAYPVPQVELTTQLDVSLQNIGDKTLVQSSQIPATDGSLNFSSEMEIVSRSINHQTGDVIFKLAFTSFSGIRSGYVAPSDAVVSVGSQAQITVASGRGASYIVGWVMRLYNSLTNSYESDSPNTILSIVGDVITFANNWSTTLTTNHKIRFADYDQSIASQLRYCFLSANGANFSDGKPTYKVTYG